jgi:hypothetical protein
VPRPLALLPPWGPAERQALRSICERTVQFENYFLSVYRGFLLAELHGGPNAACDRAR